MTNASHGVGPVPVDSAQRMRVAVVALGCIVAISALGTGLFYTNEPLLTIAPLMGVTAALGTRRRLDAAVVAFLGVLLGTACAAGVSIEAWSAPSVWLPSVAPVAATAAVLALMVRWALDSSPRLTPILTVAGVAFLIGAAWLGSTSSATYAPEGKQSLVQMMTEQPQFTPLGLDETVYLHYEWRLRHGEAYYPAAISVLDEGNRLRGVNVDLTNPLSYRLPTLYWLLARLPAGMPTILVFLFVGSLAAVSTFAVARRFLSVPVALVAASAVTAQFFGYSRQMRIMGAEVWAGFLGLTAVALFVLALTGDRATRGRLLAASLAAALAAAMVRELAVVFLLLGLVAVLAEPDLRRKRFWIPWALGIAASFAVYAAHSVAASSAIQQAGVTSTGLHASWLRPFGTPLLAGVYLSANVAGWLMPPMAVLFGLGLAGALAVRARAAVRVMLTGAVVGGCGALLLLGPSGVADANGLAPAYWASLVAPVVVASSVLVLTRLPEPWLAAVSADRTGPSREGF